MSLTYDQISSITHKKFIPKMIDNIFDSHILLKRMRSKAEMIDGGERIMVPLLYAANASAGWFTGNDTLATNDTDQITAAAYTWKQAFANITISRLDELKNSGEAQVLSLVKNKTIAAEKSLADIIATGLYNDGTTLTKAIGGLRLICSTSSTVGGISQSSYSWWQANVDSSSTTMTMGALQSVWTDSCMDAEKPSVITATRDNYDRYYNLLQPQQRFSDAETAKGGFQNLMFNGSPFVVDSYVPANGVFMLNEDYLKLYIHKDENFRFEPFVKPIDQNVKVAKIYFAGALGSSNNSRHGYLSALAA